MNLKLIIPFFVFCFLSLNSYSQDYSTLKDIPLITAADFTQAEPLVMECSKYLLATPIDETDLNAMYSILFIARWNKGTPDYSFYNHKTIIKWTKSNYAISGVYLACMTEYMLENKDKAKDEKNVDYNSAILFLNYCEQASHKVKLNAGLKKALKARNENKLEEYIEKNEH